jgi:3-hydroxyacyl-[acyl-carrier-protein] dehydratase
MRLEYFRMVDRITAIDLDAKTIAVASTVPEASPVFEGHFPGYPILPGVLMIETIAQAGGWLLLGLMKCARMPFLVQTREAKARGFVAPGEKLVITAHLVHDGSGYAVCAGNIRRDGKLVADAEITYRVIDFPNDQMRGMMRATAREIGLPEELHG